MPALTVGKVERALKATFGNISLAAKNLGVSRQAVYDKCEQYPRLRLCLADARESMVDNAESALGLAVNNGQPWAVSFTLKTIGKNRGYIEKTEVKNEVKLNVTGLAESMTDDELAARIRELRPMP